MRRVLKEDGKIMIIIPLEGFSPCGLIYRFCNPYKNIRLLLSKAGIFHYNLPSPHIHFFTYRSFLIKIAQYFTVVDSFTRGSFSFLIIIVLSPTLSIFSRYKFKLSDILKHRFPTFFSKAYRKTNSFPFIGTYVLKKH
jgi:hypothetical protein